MDDYRPVARSRVDEALRVMVPVELSDRERNVIYDVFGRRGASYDTPLFRMLPAERRMEVLRAMSHVGGYLLLKHLERGPASPARPHLRRVK